MDALIETGKPAPELSLQDLYGRFHQLSAYLGKIVLLNFWSAECPWAARADQDLAPKLRQWGDGVVLLTIASNANESTEMLQRSATERGLERVLVDARQINRQRPGAHPGSTVWMHDRARSLTRPAHTQVFW